MLKTPLDQPKDKPSTVFQKDSAVFVLPPEDTQPEDDRFPSLDEVIAKCFDFDQILNLCDPKIKDRLKGILTVTPSKDYPELFSRGSVFTPEMFSILSKLPNDKPSKKRMQELIRQRKSSRLKNILTHVGQSEKVPEDVITKLIDEIVAEDDVTSLNKIFSCTAITDRTKNHLWDTVYHDASYIRLAKGWQLKDQCTEEIGKLLIYFIKGDQARFIERLTEQIVESKSINNTIIMDDKELSISNGEKETLTNAIIKLSSFKEYCENGGRDIQYFKANVKLELLNMLSTIINVFNNRAKLDIINELIRQPSLRTSNLKDLAEAQQAELAAQLKKSKVFQDYKKSVRSKLSLQEMKKLAIDEIIQTKKYLEPKDAEAIRDCLMRFDMNALFKIPVVWKEYRDFHDLIYHSKKAEGYKIALDQNDQDFNELESLLREKLEEQLVLHQVNPLRIDEIINRIMDMGDLKVVEGNKDLSSNQQTQLPKVIEQIPEYRELKKSKWQPKNIENIIKFEVRDAIIHTETAIRTFAHVIDLTNRIYNSKTIDEVDNSLFLNAEDKKTIKKALADEKKCPVLSEYLRYFGCDKATAVYHLKQAFIPVRRELEIGYAVFEKMEADIIKNQNFDGVRTSPDITEYQRAKLLEFLLNDHACQDYVNACRKYLALERMEKLHNEISTQFANQKSFKSISGYEESVVAAMLDYYCIDESIQERECAGIEVKEILDNGGVMAVVRKVEASPPYKNFRKSYGFLMEMRMRTSEEAFKRFFDSQIEEAECGKKEGDDLFTVFKNDFHYEKGRLARYRNPIPPKKTQAIARNIEDSSQYDALISSINACNIQKVLIGSSTYENTLEDLKYQKELWKLDDRTVENLIARLAELDINALTDETQLSSDDKKNLAEKIINSEGFKKYYAAKDELDEETNSRLSAFSENIQKLSQTQLPEIPTGITDTKCDSEDEAIAESVSPKKISRTVDKKESKNQVQSTEPNPTKSSATEQAGKRQPESKQVVLSKDDDYLRTRASAVGIPYNNQRFDELGISFEDFKTNTTPEFRQAYIGRIDSKIEQTVDSIFEEYRTKEDSTLGKYIIKGNESLVGIRNTLITTGTAEIDPALPKIPRGKLIGEIQNSQGFKSLVSLVEHKKSITG